MKNYIDWSEITKVWGAYEMMGISPNNLNEIDKYFQSPICIVGAGSGINVKYLEDKMYDVVGVDNNESMINLAKNIRDVNLCNASADDLPFEKSSFNTVILATGIFNQVTLYKEFSEKIIKEAKRVLKPGGKVILGYFIEDRNLNYVFDRLGLNKVPSNNKYFIGANSLSEVKNRFINESDLNHRTIEYVFIEYENILSEHMELINKVCSELALYEDKNGFVENNIGFDYHDLNKIDVNYLNEMFKSQFKSIDSIKVNPGDVSIIVGESL